MDNSPVFRQKPASYPHLRLITAVDMGIKRLTISLVFLCFTLVIPFAFVRERAVTSEKNGFTVVIDAGHGGIDGGAVSPDGKVYESDINLKIAEKLKDRFISGGFNVVMTRTTSNGLYGVIGKGFKRRDMAERVKIAENAKADALISVHLNKYFDSSRRGAQTFFKADSENGKKLAECVQSAFNADINSDRAYSSLAGDYYILNETNMPAVICECGFISNEKDYKLLLTDEHAEKLANAIFFGAINFFASV